MWPIIVALDALRLINYFAGYGVDKSQRGPLFLEALNRRDNQYLEHNMAGQPPLFFEGFELEELFSGKDLKENPVNYRLCRVIDRRKSTKTIKTKERRTLVGLKKQNTLRPIAILTH